MTMLKWRLNSAIFLCPKLFQTCQTQFVQNYSKRVRHHLCLTRLEGL